MTFIFTFLLLLAIAVIIKHSYRVYKEPAAVLGRQAANMNWVAVGQVKDSDGFNNVRYVRDGMEAEVSFQDGNVSLIEPISETFKDFKELEQSLGNLNATFDKQVQEMKDLYEESMEGFEDLDDDEDLEDLLEDEEITYEDYFHYAFQIDFRGLSRKLDNSESFDVVEELIEVNDDVNEKVNELFLAGFDAKIDKTELAAMFLSTVALSINPKNSNDINLDKGLEEINNLIVWIKNNSND
jgi:hypothetical protein